MKRKIESKESMRGGSTAEGGSGHVTQPLSVSEQLHTKSCARCSGLLVTEWYYDLHNTGADDLETLRCVQCGHRVDPVILQNQIQPSVEYQSLRQVRPRYSTRTGMLS